MAKGAQAAVRNVVGAFDEVRSARTGHPFNVALRMNIFGGEDDIPF